MKITCNSAPIIQARLLPEYIYIMNLVVFFVQGLPSHLGRHYLTVQGVIERLWKESLRQMNVPPCGDTLQTSF